MGSSSRKQAKPAKKCESVTVNSDLNVLFGLSGKVHKIASTGPLALPDLSTNREMADVVHGIADMPIK